MNKVVINVPEGDYAALIDLGRRTGNSPVQLCLFGLKLALHTDLATLARVAERSTESCEEISGLDTSFEADACPELAHAMRKVISGEMFP